MTYTSTQVQLIKRPHGVPRPTDFALVTQTLPQPKPGELIIRNSFISVDPYMRGRMNDVPSYQPPFALDTAMDGGAVGVIEASGDDSVSTGEYVLHSQGWRDVALVKANEVRRVDPSKASSPGDFLSVLGMTGLTAYTGLLDVAEMSPGDTVFVSGAAGAVGQMVGQIARLKGAKRVIGSAGSAKKLQYLTGTLGFDAAFNYKDGSLVEKLRGAAPDGIDVYFDNVGGAQLEAAIEVMNTHGRAALCGAISQYNLTEASSGPRNLTRMIGQRLMLRGFLVLDHYDRMPDFVSDVEDWLSGDKLIHEETIVDGIENAVDAFVGMLDGENLGKMLVRI